MVGLVAARGSLFLVILHDKPVFRPAFFLPNLLEFSCNSAGFVLYYIYHNKSMV